MEGSSEDEDEGREERGLAEFRAGLPERGAWGIPRPSEVIVASAASSLLPSPRRPTPNAQRPTPTPDAQARHTASLVPPSPTCNHGSPHHNRRGAKTTCHPHHHHHRHRPLTHFRIAPRHHLTQAPLPLLSPLINSPALLTYPPVPTRVRRWWSRWCRPGGKSPQARCRGRDLGLTGSVD